MKTVCILGCYGASGAAQDCPSLCPAGYFSSPGASACATCAAGTFSSQGASFCENCTTGFSSPPGSSSCIPLPSNSPTGAPTSLLPTRSPTSPTSFPSLMQPYHTWVDIDPNSPFYRKAHTSNFYPANRLIYSIGGRNQSRNFQYCGDVWSYSIDSSQ